MRAEAYLSDDRRYRYWLLRVWDDSLPLLCPIGVNPSKADEKENDPTIRREIGFGERNGFGGLFKLNVGAYRATDPRDWRKAIDPIGPENTVGHLKAYIALFRPEKVVVCWGKNGNFCKPHCERIIREILGLWCFGKNPDGTPRHPLMLPYSTQIERFNSELVTA
jgi:hypothetical protein